MFKRINLIAKTIRNLGLIIGVPMIVTLAVQYHFSRIQKYEDELRVLKRHVELEKTKTSIAEKMSYANVESLITSQKEVYKKEINIIKSKILEKEKEIARLKKVSENLKQPPVDDFLEQVKANLKNMRVLQEKADKLQEKADKLQELRKRMIECNGKKPSKDILREVYLIERERILLATNGQYNGWPNSYIVDEEDKSKRFVLPSIQDGQSIDDAVMNAWSLCCGSKDFANEEECKGNVQQGASH